MAKEYPAEELAVRAFVLSMLLVGAFIAAVFLFIL
jgi:hypothetical protein